MPERLPPYYQNFDGSHCLQCSLRSALEYFNPDKTWSWAELDELTGKVPNKPTWQMSFLSELGKRGYKVVCIEDFNLAEFVVDPQGYLQRSQSPEAYDYIIRSIDFDHEVTASKNLLDAERAGLAELHYRNSNAEDIRHYLQEGYLVIHWVNSRAMNEKEGFRGHFILLYGLKDENTVWYHENGGLHNGQPTGMDEQKVNIDFLVKCGDTGGRTGGFYAIKPLPQQKS